MKLIGLSLATATLLGTLAVATPALADRVVERHTVVVHHNAHWGHHRVCHTNWVHHHRVTHCR